MMMICNGVVHPIALVRLLTPSVWLAVPVQKAIAELAKTGSELEAGNLGGVVSSVG